MLRNYLAAALRNLVRNRLYAAINIIGLAIGFAAALLIALFVRSEYSFENFLPGKPDLYHITVTRTVPSTGMSQADRITPNFAALLKTNTSAVEDITRLFRPTDAALLVLRKGEIESREEILWADANIFAVLPLPVVAGDLGRSLETPDAIVMTRALARKYFGRDDPIGETLELDRQHPVRVTAVIEDLPPETHFRFSALASGISSVSPQTAFNTTLAGNARNYEAAYTYLRLKPGSDPAAVTEALRETGLHPSIAPSAPMAKTYGIEPIGAIHLRPAAGDAMKPSSGRDSIVALAAVGLLILVVAGINFVNLMTARAMRRAVEVGVRKVSGAERRDLIAQFIGEALIYAAISGVAALALSLAALASFNAFVERTIAMRFSPAESLVMLFAVCLFSLGAGFYPAFVLSAFRPSKALWRARDKTAGTGWGHSVLVSVQFAVFVGLILVGVTIWRQTVYGMKEGLRLNTDAVLIVDAGGCVPAFRNAVRELPGVRDTACSLGAPLEWFRGVTAQRAGATQIIIGAPAIDFGFLELYGLAPVAGRFFDESFGGDTTVDERGPSAVQVVINEAAARALGFSSADTAVGQTILWGSGDQVAQIIGVAPDYRIAGDTIRDAAPPISFVINPGQLRRFAGQNQLHVKLDGRKIPETLEAIDSLWRSLGAPRPITRFFFDTRVQETFAGIVRQAQVFGVFSAIALFVACLGLFGLAAFTAEQRTKEIGIRKSMGATRTDILRLLLWQFTKPVLLANLIAWPAAYFVMRRWLEGFADHISLSPWMFLAASALALGIAVVTVIGHALLVARARPVAALRYE